MGMTITEKILAAHAGLKEVRAGELVFASIDLALATDVTAPAAIREFERMGAEKVFDPDKVALVNDHFVPAKDIASAELSKVMRDFARRMEIRNYFEVGRSGICHVVLPEAGLVAPGDLIVGADSHTCTYGALGAFATGVGHTDLAGAMALGETWFKVPETILVRYHGRLPLWVMGKDLILLLLGKIGVEGALYKAIEYAGEVVENLPIADRFTLANMAVEAGAKNGIVAPDDATRDYLKGKVNRDYPMYRSDPDAVYTSVIDFDVTDLEPLVAEPSLPSNVKPISQVERVSVDQVVIGSCTNGRIEDFRIAHKLLNGKRVHPKVRLIIQPGSDAVLRQMVKEGLADSFLEAGAIISPATCGPCIGGHMGVLARGEVCVSTTSRNFKGRMGHVESQVYLSNPAVAAASALLGRIADPREVE